MACAFFMLSLYFLGGVLNRVRRTPTLFPHCWRTYIPCASVPLWICPFIIMLVLFCVFLCVLARCCCGLGAKKTALGAPFLAGSIGARLGLGWVVPSVSRGVTQKSFVSALGFELAFEICPEFGFLRCHSAGSVGCGGKFLPVLLLFFRPWSAVRVFQTDTETGIVFLLKIHFVLTEETSLH
jgi:hypothetical protein